MYQERLAHSTFGVLKPDKTGTECTVGGPVGRRQCKGHNVYFHSSSNRNIISSKQLVKNLLIIGHHLSPDSPIQVCCVGLSRRTWPALPKAWTCEPAPDQYRLVVILCVRITAALAKSRISIVQFYFGKEYMTILVSWEDSRALILTCNCRVLQVGDLNNDSVILQ